MKRIIEHKSCERPKCDGEKKYTGESFSNSIGSYHLHKCTICESTTQYKIIYPNVYTEYSKKEIVEKWV